MNKQQVIDSYVKEGYTYKNGKLHPPTTLQLQQNKEKQQVIDSYVKDGYTYKNGKLYAPTKFQKFTNTIGKIGDVGAGWGAGIAQNTEELGRGLYNLIGPHLLGTKKASRINMVPEPIRRNKLSSSAESVGEWTNPLLWASPEIKAGEMVGEGLTHIPQIAKLTEHVPALLKSLMTRSATGAATGGAYGAVLSPDEQKVGGVFGAGVGGTLGGIAHLPEGLAKSLLGKIKKSSLDGYVRSPEKIKRILKKLKPLFKKTKISMNIGDLTKYAPTGKFYHDILGNILGSGVRGKAQKVLNIARKHASNILNKLSQKSDPALIDTNLINYIKSHKAKVLKEFNKRYDNLYDEADTLGYKAKTNNLVNTANSKYIKKFLHEDYEDNVDPKAIRAIKKAQIHKEQSFSKLTDQKTRYNDSWKKATPGSFEANIYTTLKDAVKTDLDEGVRGTQDENLIKNYKEISKDYANLYAPMKDKALLNILSRGKNPDKIENVLLKGHFKSVLKELPMNVRKKIMYKKFINSIEDENTVDEHVNPFKLNRFYKKLKAWQKESLLGVVDQEGMKIRDHFKNLHTLVKAAREPALQEQRPFTGGRLVMEGLKHAPGFLTATALLTPHKIAAGLSGAAFYGGANLLEKALTSNWMRKAYISGEFPKLLSKYPELASKYGTRASNMYLGQQMSP